jgi:hypothetical protein
MVVWWYYGAMVADTKRLGHAITLAHHAGRIVMPAQKKHWRLNIESMLC